MNYCQSICGICLLCCSFSAVFSEDDFSKIEKDVLNNPSPAITHESDKAVIDTRVKNSPPQRAMDAQPDKLKTSSRNEFDAESVMTESKPYLKVNKDGIKVYIYSHKNSAFGTFKATTHINASMDSILAVLFDSRVCPEWIHACEKSIVLESLGFSERYHYQVLDVPFPFNNREFIFHSIMVQNPSTKAITITMSAEADYCEEKKTELCEVLNQSNLVRVKKSIGTYKLEPVTDGINITWIQHTDPEGNLPAWLVNKFVADTPYWTFKNLAKMVTKDKYKYAKLIYDNRGFAVNLTVPDEKSTKTIRRYDVFPTF